MRLAERLGAVASQMGPERIQGIEIRLCGTLAETAGADVLAAAATAGAIGPALTGGVSIVNAKAVARARGIDVVESRSSRPSTYTSLMSVLVQAEGASRSIEGTVFEPASLRIVSVAGVPVEAALSGTVLILENDDRPGVIGIVGSILGGHGINIASFALGRRDRSAIGVVNLDERETPDAVVEEAVGEIRRVPAIQNAWLIRL